MAYYICNECGCIDNFTCFQDTIQSQTDKLYINENGEVEDSDYVDTETSEEGEYYDMECNECYSSDVSVYQQKRDRDAAEKRYLIANGELEKEPINNWSKEIEGNTNG